MKRAGVVALNTFREAVRDRVLYNLLFFALVMMAASIIAGQISIGIEQTVIVTLGLSAISLIGLLISVFIGVGLVSKEMDKRTLYAVLAKPVRRWEFLLGKFGGLVLTLAVNVTAMAVGLFLALLYVKPALERGDATVLIAVYFIWLKLALVVALALLFSCFTTPLLDITTTLDSNLIVAYRFGAIFLSQRAPGGAGRPDLAVRLIERGIKANPDYWRLYEDLGFIYYMDLKDYKKASEAFLEGSKNPQALIWMKVMAAKIAAEGESYETSFFLWNDVYRNTSDPQIKENAKAHLQLLRAREDSRQLDLLGGEYEKRFGHRPRRVSELVDAGMLQAIAVDPLGYPYTFDENGNAALNPKSPLLEKQKFFERFK